MSPITSSMPSGREGVVGAWSADGTGTVQAVFLAG
ncbi:hypothetical protein QE418_002192 [Microbacterium testaceum]|nr:hypothetical protein [Microbacterium testaceum]MDR6096717.1 hypothetical protein [Microbacterium sp. SORGH_AS_0454]